MTPYLDTSSFALKFRFQVICEVTSTLKALTNPQITIPEGLLHSNLFFMENLKIEELTSFSEDTVLDISSLMQELNPDSFTSRDRLENVVENPSMHLYVIRDTNRIVASATLCVCHTPEHVIGFVEAVVVKKDYRGHHLGRRLMERIIKDASTFGVEQIHLTSNPKRIAANSLYLSLGFLLYQTNCYHLKI